MPSRKGSAPPSSSRIKEIWRSVISWMHWSRRREQRQLEQQWEMLKEHRQALEQYLHSQLLEALTPVAAALLRQDDLAMKLHDLQTELQMEILSSLHPTAEQQIFQAIGPPTPQPSSRSSAR